MSNLSSIYGEDDATLSVTHTSTQQEQGFRPPVPDQALPEQEAPLLSRDDPDAPSSGDNMCRKVFGTICGVFIAEYTSFREAANLLQGTGKLWVVRQGFIIHWISIVASVSNVIASFGLGAVPILAALYCLLVLYFGFYCVFSPIFDSLKTDSQIGWVTSLFFFAHCALACMMIIGLPPHAGFIGLWSFDANHHGLATAQVITMVLWGVVFGWSIYFWKSAREL